MERAVQRVEASWCGGGGGRAHITAVRRADRHTQVCATESDGALCNFSILELSDNEFSSVRKSVFDWAEFLSLKKTKSSFSRVISSVDLEFGAYGVLRYPRYHPAPSYPPSTRKPSPADKMMAVAAAQKNREMFAMKSSYSIEVSSLRFMSTKNLQPNSFYKIVKSRKII